jgi:PAS domain S-box-containing protein
VVVAKVRILLVEDERSLALITERHLQRLGYQVETVRSGDDALAAVDRQLPALVLMDINLGDAELDGVETAAILLQRHDVPVIYLTAADDDETIQRAARTEAYGYILKPPERPQLRSAIAMAMGRHRAEQRLVQTKQLLWTTLRGIRDGVLTTDASGRVVMANQAAEELTGLDVAELVGRPLSEALALEPQAERARFQRGITALLDGEESFALARTKLRGREGAHRDIALSASPIVSGDDDRVPGVVLVLRDIAEQLRGEQELLRRQKLETIERLAGGLAHEFNNVLMAMLGNVALARLGQPASEVDERLLAAEVAGERATELTRQLLLFSDGAPSKRRPLAVASLLRHQIRLSLHRSAVSARFELPTEELHVEGDETQLCQLIHALVATARDAMPQGGPLQVRVRPRVVGAPGARQLSQGEADEGQAADAAEPGDYVEIEVEYRGDVLEAAELTEIFDPYAGGFERQGGLLLAAAQSIARHHGGALGVRAAAPADGMCFVALLPAATPRDAQRTVPIKAVCGSGFVLLMDDEQLIRDAVGRLLSRLGYRLEVVNDGAAAIAAFTAARDRGEPFDAVILDWTIRDGLGGEETLVRLREIDAGIPAILATGYAQGGGDWAADFDAVLYKPYSMVELSTKLADVMSQEAAEQPSDAAEPSDIAEPGDLAEPGETD